MKQVFIFRGAPATGKGTIVPEFCKILAGPVVLISQDALRWGFHLIGRHVTDISDDEHALANKNAEILYEQYLKSGNYTIVLEGLFTWDNEKSSQGNAKHLVELAHDYGFDARSIVLKADKEELLARNGTRQYEVPSKEFEMLHDGVYKTVDASEIVVDSTGQTPDETIRVLKSTLGL